MVVGMHIIITDCFIDPGVNKPDTPSPLSNSQLSKAIKSEPCLLPHTTVATMGGTLI